MRIPFPVAGLNNNQIEQSQFSGRSPKRTGNRSTSPRKDNPGDRYSSRRDRTSPKREGSGNPLQTESTEQRERGRRRDRSSSVDMSPLVHPNPRAANDWFSPIKNLYLSRSKGRVLSRSPSTSRYDARGEHENFPAKASDAADEGKDSDQLLEEAISIVDKNPAAKTAFHQWSTDRERMKRIKDKRIENEEARVASVPWQQRGKEPGSVVQAWGRVDRTRVRTPEPDHDLTDKILDNPALKEHPEMSKEKYTTLADYLYMGRVF